MNAWLAQHRRALTLTGRQIAASPVARTFQALVIGVAITLPLLLYLTVQNLARLAGQSDADARIALYLAADATAKEAAAISTRLDAHAGVAGHRFVARDEALRDLKQRHDIADLVDALPKNPLPDAFVVRAASLRPGDIEALRSEASAWPKVALAQLDSAWAARLDAGLDLARSLALGLGTVLAAALLAVTFNTIGLQIVNRREEIEVSRLIGATHGFIRRPFLYAGVVQGAAGGALACAFAGVCVFWVNEQLRGVAALYGTELAARALPAGDALAVIGFSALLGWLGAWLAVTRHLLRLDSQLDAR
ncbi:MAG: ABC transporter permease [Proteobacteria bacterium]|nr:ABC transporter permease [Burkholderiales bacterium]